MQVRSWSLFGDQLIRKRFLPVNVKHVLDDQGSVVGKGIVIFQIWLILSWEFQT